MTEDQKSIAERAEYHKGNLKDLTKDEIVHFLPAVLANKDAVIAELRAALAKSQPVEQGEPVAWQYRMRPDWEDRWQDWIDCSKEAYRNMARTPLLHDWHYEVRELFTHPVRPMSDEQIAQWMPVGLLRTEEFVYQKGIKDAEKFHGIKGATE